MLVDFGLVGSGVLDDPGLAETDDVASAGVSLSPSSSVCPSSMTGSC